MVRNEVEDAYERATRDPLFLSAVRKAHAGRWDVLDALWWESHPMDPSPSGSAAPAAQLRDLQRRLFSAAGDAAGNSTVAEAAQQLASEIATEREAIKDAVARIRFETQSEPRDQLSRAHAEEAPPIRAVQPLDPTDEDGEPGGQEMPPRPPHRAAVLGIIAALCVGIVVGTQIAGGEPDSPPVASASPEASAASTVVLEVAPLAPVVAFEAPQTTDDIPARAMPAIFDPDSFRILAERGPLGGNGDEAVYAARTTSNMICLVISGSEPGYLSTCTLEADFPPTGLRLYWPDEIVFQTEDGESVTSGIERFVVWKPDASLEWY